MHARIWVALAIVAAGCGKKRDSAASLDIAEPMSGSSNAAMEVKGDEKAADKDKDKPAETWKRSQIVPNTSRVMVGDSEELALRAMQAHVTIDGFRARVVIDYLFANDRNTQLEGTFQLRLPEEASPYFFAFGDTGYEVDRPGKKMWIAAPAKGDGPKDLVAQREGAWHGPNEAQMVPREKAAFAYGETVRRRVDPALVEWAGAGVFNARVFPLAGAQRAPDRRRLRRRPDPDRRRSRVPLDLPEKAPEASVDIGVAADRHGRRRRCRAGRSARARCSTSTSPKDHRVAVRIANAGAPLLVGHDDAGVFFATRVTPALPATARGGNDAAVFLVDTSLIVEPGSLQRLAPADARRCSTTTATRSSTSTCCSSASTRTGTSRASSTTRRTTSPRCSRYANTLALEGATDLGAALGEAAHPAGDPAGRYDLFLLSDGAATWGEANLHALGQSARRARARCSRTRPGSPAPTSERSRTSRARPAARCSR